MGSCCDDIPGHPWTTPYSGCIWGITGWLFGIPDHGGNMDGQRDCRVMGRIFWCRGPMVISMIFQSSDGFIVNEVFMSKNKSTNWYLFFNKSKCMYVVFYKLIENVRVLERSF